VPREEYAEGFKGDAQRAFRAGDELAAMRYLYAYALTSEEGANELLPSMGWVGALKRPSLAVRYGLGIDFSGPSNLTDLKPIGSTQQMTARNDRRRGNGADGGGAPGGPVGPDMAGPGGLAGLGGGLEGMAGMGGAAGAIAAAATNPELAKFAGDFGTQLLSVFVTRSQQGSFGKVLQDAGRFRAAGLGGGAVGGAAGMGGPAGYAAAGAMAGGSGGSAEAPGMPAMPGMPGGPGGSSPVGPGGYPGVGAADAIAAVTGGLNLAPGLTFVGIGSRKQLQQKAQEKGLDVLVVLEVTVKQNPRMNVVTNDSQVTMYDARKGTRLAGTKPLNNIAVQVKRAEKKDDGLQAEIDGFVNYLDNNLIIAEMPAVLNDREKAQPIIASRVTALAASQPENPLETLVEIHFWKQRGLIDDATLLSAVTQLAGEETAKSLTSGTEEERKLAVEKWLPPKRS